MARTDAPLATLANPRDLWLGNAERYERYASAFPKGSEKNLKWLDKAAEARIHAETYSPC